MKNKQNKYGFSLTEVLLAVGTLSIGMIFVAGVFPVAVHFSTAATEQTLAAVVADEAFAKIRLYGEYAVSELLTDWVSDLPPNECVIFEDAMPMLINQDEFGYPSDPNSDPSQRRYYWYALCRRIGTTRLVQVTVFVSRKTNPNRLYRTPDGADNSDFPMPVEVGVTAGGSAELTIDDLLQRSFINDDYRIVDDYSGWLYRVLERKASSDDTILLDRDWQGGPAASVWVVPPPVNGGRYPCLAAYQKVIGFWAY
ncbi:MAG: type IV pilus modification PilV family protein [Planctomycetota bacterium]|jgi:type II secretory pathway pseudopilin PulG